MALTFKSFLESDADHAKQLAKTGFWGKAAAGVIFKAADTGKLLLAHRSDQVQEPETWGTWGGALDKGEDPAAGAEREAREETHYTGELKLKHLWTYEDPSGFRYHNYLATVPEEFYPALSWESKGYRWVDYGNWPRPLHFGLAALLKHADKSLLV